MNLAAVDTIWPQSNKFVTGMKIKATGESKLNDSPAHHSEWFTLDMPQHNKNLFGAFSLDNGTYPAVKENHQKAKAEEDNQCHKQETSHHGEVILS